MNFQWRQQTFLFIFHIFFSKKISSTKKNNNFKKKWQKNLLFQNWHVVSKSPCDCWSHIDFSLFLSLSQWHIKHSYSSSHAQLNLFFPFNRKSFFPLLLLLSIFHSASLSLVCKFNLCQMENEKKIIIKLQFLLLLLLIVFLSVSLSLGAQMNSCKL